MATGGIYGASAESVGLYGIGSGTGNTYFEWFIFNDSATAPATPTGGSWSFTTNTGTAPSGWLNAPPASPTNLVWVSIAVVDSRTSAALTWSTPGLMNGAGLPVLTGSGAPSSGLGLNTQLYLDTSTTPQSLYNKQSGTWVKVTGSTLYMDLTSNQTIAGTKTFSSEIQGDISGNAANVTGTVAIANGGTGSATAGGARTNLGVPSLTGSGASGTWSINVTGNAATATSAVSVQGVTGDVVGTTQAQTLTNKTISGSANTLTDIANASLVNDSFSMNGQTFTLGAVQLVGADLFLPSYTGNAGKVLTVNTSASDIEWRSVSGTGTVTSVDVSGGSTGLTATGGPITAAGTITIGGTLALASGGTGATTASGARGALGLGTAAQLNAGIAGGVATLDGGGTVPTSQLPAAVLGAIKYQGTWDANANSPTLASSTGTEGHYYVVSVAGSTNLNGITDWKIGDWAIFNGTAWQKIDNTDAVTSVNGYTGTVVLTYTDVGAANSGTNTNITSMTGVTGGITTPDYVAFDVNPSTVPTAPGSLYWDSADGNQTLSLVMAGGNAIQQIGQEQYFRIKASSAITEGQVVMFTGTVGASGALTGAPATGLTASTASYVMGIATQNIALNDWGYVTSFGLVRQINTNAWTAGTILYYDPTVAGGLTSTIPTAPNAKVQVCAVVYQGTSNGSLFVRTSFGGILGQYEGDVNLPSIVDSDLLVRDAATGTWIASTTSTTAAQLPKGTTAQRPTGVSGKLRFNTTTGEFEGYNGAAWASVGGSAISNDTSTATNLYPLFASATSGTASSVYTSNAQYLFKPSTGELRVKAPVAANGIVVNADSVSSDYTIAAGTNGFSIGPLTINSGVVLTIASGQRHVVI